MSKFALPLFIVVALFQWAVPVSMIVESESTITDGNEYRFKTMPVDPSDPFRGKYITLSFEEEQYQADTVPQFLSGMHAYVTVEVDEEGFANLTNLSLDEMSDIDYDQLEVVVSSSYNDGYLQQVRLELPFTRFYLEESKASDAEQAYWSAQLDSAANTYALVRVKGGKARVVDVKINEKSIGEIVEEMNFGEEENQ